MSKQSAQLANAERVADEAIASLNTVNEVFKTILKEHPGRYPATATLLEQTELQVRRLRAELEGEG